VFSLWRKTGRDGADVMSSGRIFRDLGRQQRTTDLRRTQVLKISKLDIGRYDWTFAGNAIFWPIFAIALLVLSMLCFRSVVVKMLILKAY